MCIDGNPPIRGSARCARTATSPQVNPWLCRRLGGIQGRLSSVRRRKPAQVTGAAVALIAAALRLIERSANGYSSNVRMRAAMLPASSDVPPRCLLRWGETITVTQPLARRVDGCACLALASLSVDLEAVKAASGQVSSHPSRLAASDTVQRPGKG